MYRPFNVHAWTNAAPYLARRSAVHAAHSRLRCVMLNADRLDFDGRIDFARLGAVAELTKYGKSDPTFLEEIASRCAHHDVVINKEMPIPRDVIERMRPSVRLICEAGTGFNNIDLEAAREHGIAVCNLPTYSTEAMAHMTITFILALSCSLATQLRTLHAGSRQHFEACHLGSLSHFELTGKTLGLIGGLGTIGQRVTAIARVLGMEVLASSSTSPPGASSTGAEVAPLTELLARSDFVSIHCPLNAKTKGLLDAAALSRMKPTAYLINTSRAPLLHLSCNHPFATSPSSDQCSIPQAERSSTKQR